MRQSRTSGAVTDEFVWDTTASIPLLLTDGPSLYIYGPALTPVAQVDAAGKIEYLHTDNIGSVRVITDSTGAVVGATDFTPYGAASAHMGAATSNFGFATAWADPLTGFNYLRARDYDPATGQFLQVDPVVDATHQPYAYVAGDPLASIDPSGLCVGMDGTPQDRNCTSNDYFWAGLPGAIYDQLIIATAGFNDGLTYGTALLVNGDQQRYGDNLEFWAEYAIGVVITSAILGSAVAPAYTAAAKSEASVGGAAVVRVGPAGEASVRSAYDIGPKAAIKIECRDRILDGLNKTAVSEVKNVRYQAFTQQLKDSLAFAQQTGRDFDLYVRGGANVTKLSAPLQKAVNDGTIILKYIP